MKGRPLSRPGQIFVYTMMTAFALLTLGPYLWSLILSLETAQEASAFPPHLWPAHPSLESYRYIVGNAPFLRWFWNSTVVAGAITLSQLFFNSLTGYALARLPFPGREAVFLFVLASMMVPGLVTLVPLYMLISNLHWIDTYYALVVPFATQAFGVFLMRQFFLALPRELEEAARLEGLTPFGIFCRIALPLARPALATQGLLTFMGAWNGFMWPFIVTNSQAMFTLTVGLQSFRTSLGSGGNYVFWNDVMAGSMIMTVPIVLIYIVLQRHFIKGIATTGLRG